ncbi:hypothetical protein LTR17_023141 [Elasticomyces elasticus]|nr:hypothetical protein LTR17_023141 [Elasticomyces elasticus]
MACEVEAFRYPVLEAEQRQIRLLTVQKGDLEGDLACSLDVVSLDDAIEFTALSYVWGTEQPVCSIQVDGHTLWIRSNLHAYLILAADEQTKGRGIFIDAICINQNDTAERSSQVALMGRVYSQADEVVVWFGMEEEWTSLLLFKHPSTRDNDVFFHAAFRRRFLHGDILERFGNMSTRNDVRPAEDRNSDCSNTFVALRLLSIESTTEQKIIPLYRAVSSFAGQDCFLMYDKIFGLLGLSDSSVIPDYSRTPLQIYAQVLIEGLREIARGTNLDSHDDPTLAMVNFITSLTSSLELVFEQPAVMLVTLLAIDRTDLELDDLMCFMNMTLQLRQPRLYQLVEDWDSEVLMQLSYVEATSAMRRVECMRESNIRIVGPDGVAKAYAAWEQDVDEADEIVRGKSRQP